MNLRDLHYIVAVAHLQHFGRAAEKCCVSQPTLSGQIKKLEDELGVRLFERTNRRVIPTDVGIRILSSARRILEEERVMSEVAKSAQDPLAGKFRLGAFPTLATYVFPKFVSQVRRKLPLLRLILIEEKTASLLDQLKRGEIDAALLALPLSKDSLAGDFLVSQKLFDDEFYLAVISDHELASYKRIRQDILSRYPLLLLEEGHCLRDQALELCKLHNGGEVEDFKATGLETLRQMVKAGTGITLIPKIATSRNERGICYIPFVKPAPTRTIGLVWRKTTSREEVLKYFVKIFSLLF